ncbi:unnamed protein product [Paramecium primaurelia]|uniref:Uncharacterized protein n=1 Tax=Paramecium primaurelia TaxID=5886 RepID=A0A8S1NJB6_PARPR|nr:unnamed protein product [Paramecium primaurelia]
MSSLFAKCMNCNQKPAIINFLECKPGQIQHICYDCYTQVHNKKGLIDSQNKIEIISYQSIPQYNIKQKCIQRINLLQTKPLLKQKPQQQQIQYQQPQDSAKIQQFIISKKEINSYMETKNIQKINPNCTQIYQNKFETVQQLTKIKIIQRQKDQEINSVIHNLSQQNNSKDLEIQVKKEKEDNEKLKSGIQQTNYQNCNINKFIEKRIQQNQKDLEKKINCLKNEYNEDKMKNEQLIEDVKKLQDKLKITDQQLNEKLDQQNKQYEQQLKQLEQVIEKQNQIKEFAQLFQKYRIVDIQAKMEEMENEINQKNKLIKQLQNQLQEYGGRTVQNENFQIQIKQQIRIISIQDELLQNFKQLLQNMLDEKKVMVNEHKRLTKENNQFRELFSIIIQQNLHLFGINEDDQETGDETGVEEEDYHQNNDDEDWEL